MAKITKGVRRQSRISRQGWIPSFVSVMINIGWVLEGEQLLIFCLSCRCIWDGFDTALSNLKQTHFEVSTYGKEQNKGQAVVKRINAYSDAISLGCGIKEIPRSRHTSGEFRSSLCRCRSCLANVYSVHTLINNSGVSKIAKLIFSAKMQNSGHQIPSGLPGWQHSDFPSSRVIRLRVGRDTIEVGVSF